MSLTTVPPDKVLDQTINSLLVSGRTSSALRKGGFIKVGDLQNRTRDEIVHLRGIGIKGIEEITKLMNDYHLYFKGEEPKEAITFETPKTNKKELNEKQKAIVEVANAISEGAPAVTSEIYSKLENAGFIPTGTANRNRKLPQKKAIITNYKPNGKATYSLINKDNIGKTPAEDENFQMRYPEVIIEEEPKKLKMTIRRIEEKVEEPDMEFFDEEDNEFEDVEFAPIIHAIYECPYCGKQYNTIEECKACMNEDIASGKQVHPVVKLDKLDREGNITPAITITKNADNEIVCTLGMAICENDITKTFTFNTAPIAVEEFVNKINGPGITLFR